MKELLKKFEQKSGTQFTPEFLKCQKRKSVDLRDIFVYLIYDENTRNLLKIGKLLNKNRSSIYASIKRFNDRYEKYKEYRELVYKLSV